MLDTLDELTPEESLWADNQVKLLKLELEHNVFVEPFEEKTAPEIMSHFLDSILALEEMQKKPPVTSLYEQLGRPSFREENTLSNSEVKKALNDLLRLMEKQGVSLEILAPDDYEERTIYRFITNELFSYETIDLGGGWNTNFVYEEFYPNYRYDIVKQSNLFLRGLAEGTFDQLSSYLADQFLTIERTPRYSVHVRPTVINHINDLGESWWPRSLREGFVTNVSIAEDTETAQATLLLHLGVEGDPNYIVKKGVVHLSRWDFWWFIEKVVIDDWVLE